MSRAVEFFDPTLPPAEWAEIQEFVRAAVRDCHPTEPRQAQRFLVVSTRLAHYAWVRGYPLDRQVVFSREFIGQFAHDGLKEFSNSTRATYRSWAFLMSDALLTGPNRRVKAKPIGRGAASVPLTPKEMALAKAWARGQKTENRRVNATMLLALCGGAGLTSIEMSQVTADDVFVDDGGVDIEVRGDRARRVTVLAEWEAPIAAVAQAAMRKDQWLFVPRRRKAYTKNFVHSFVADTNDLPFPINSHRLRATWLVTHMAAGTPVKLLAQAAGLDSLDGLRRFVQYVPDIDAVEARRRLRSESPKHTYAEGEPL